MLIVILTSMQSGEESASFDGGNGFFVAHLRRTPQNDIRSYR